jgi:hypothetical protein
MYTKDWGHCDCFGESLILCDDSGVFTHRKDATMTKEDSDQTQQCHFTPVSNTTIVLKSTQEVDPSSVMGVIM